MVISNSLNGCAVLTLLAADLRSFGQVGLFLGKGVLIVLVTLSILATFCSVVGSLFQRWERAQQARLAQPRQLAELSPLAGEHNGREVRQAESSAALPEEIVAVIAAAVATVVESPNRIVHIQEVPAGEMAWTLESRFRHHASHQPQLARPLARH